MPRQKGFSLIELLVVMVIILVIATIAISSMLHARMTANEASAVHSLRSLNTACATYASTYGIGYPASLADLGPAMTPTLKAADLIDPVLAAGTKSGYIFTYTAGSPDASGVIHSYKIVADTVNRGVTGQRGFFTDNSFVVRFNLNKAGSVSDPPID